MNDLMESRSSFRVKFYGADHIDASTLSTSLSNIVGAIKDISSETSPNSTARLEVVSTQKGCFEIYLETIIKAIPSLFNQENLEIARDIVQIFLNIIMIKMFLGGHPPKKIESDKNETVITNNDDSKMVADRRTAKTFFNSPTIDNRTVNIFNVLKFDENRNDLVIESIEQDNTIRIRKDEFEKMSVKIVEKVLELSDRLTQTIEVSLLLKKPDLLGKSKWGFIFNKIIEAEIRDKEWLGRVQKGEIKNLYAGVKIPVRMLVEVDLDENKNPKGEPKYTIIEVLGDVIEPPQERKLFNL